MILKGLLFVCLIGHSFLFMIKPGKRETLDRFYVTSFLKTLKDAMQHRLEIENVKRRSWNSIRVEELSKMVKNYLKKKDELNSEELNI